MRKLIFPLIVILIITGLMSVFVVSEGERGFVIRFGRVLKDKCLCSFRRYDSWQGMFATLQSEFCQWR